MEIVIDTDLEVSKFIYAFTGMSVEEYAMNILKTEEHDMKKNEGGEVVE